MTIARRGLLAIVALLAAASVLVTLTWPFGMDQGIFATFGDILVHGGAPYVDAWDTKGPLPPVTYALSQALFGRGMWGIRVIDALAMLVAAASLAAGVGRIASREAAVWASAAMLLYITRLGHTELAQPDGWVGYLATATFIPLMRADGTPIPPGRLVLAGACIGLATLVKPFYAILGLVPLVALEGRRPDVVRSIVPGAALVILGASIPLVAAAGWLLARGALAEFVDVYVRYSTTAYAELGRVDLGARYRGLMAFVGGWPGNAAAFPFVIAGALALVRNQGRAGRVACAWLLLMVFGVALQGRFFLYHWLPVIPPAVLCAAFALHELGRGAPEESRPPVPRLLGAVALVLVFMPVIETPMRSVREGAAYLARRRSTDGYLGGFPGSRALDAPLANVEAARYLQARTASHERVLVWGWNSSIYFLSDRRPASRYFFSMPLVAAPNSRFATRYRRVFLDDLRASAPAYIVVGAPYAGSKEEGIDAFPQFAALLRADYRLETTIRGLDIHRRVARPASDARD